MQDKRPRNEQGEFHGMWESYSNPMTMVIWAKVMYINGIDLGFWVEDTIEKIYYAR